MRVVVVGTEVVFTDITVRGQLFGLVTVENDVTVLVWKTVLVVAARVWLTASAARQEYMSFMINDGVNGGQVSQGLL